MRRSFLVAMTRNAACFLLSAMAGCFAGATDAQAQVERPRILIVVESSSRLPLAQSLLRGIEAELGPEVTTQGEVFVEFLDMLRFNGPRDMEGNIAFMAGRYGQVELDAVVALGPNALAFVRDNHDIIAPGAPIVFGALGKDSLERDLSGRTSPDLSGVISLFDMRSTLDLALRIQPDATEIVIVAGAAVFDRQWRTTAQELLGTSYGGLPVRLLPEATADDMLAEASAFDPRSIVLLLTVNLDAAGRRFLPVQFAAALSEASPAPVWSLYETQVGQGVVGGYVEDLVATGREIGAMLRLAASKAPLPPPVRVAAVPTVDWRVMKRHNLDLDLLPEGTRILFYEPTLWERYRGTIVAVVAIIVAQAVTILALIFQRRRYFRMRETLESEREQLIHVSRNLRLGQLSAALAHEINQPLAAIQANSEAGTRLADRTPPDVSEIGTIFRDISDDVRRAAGIIANLRRLMIKGETRSEEVDLNAMVSSTLSLAENELAARGARVVRSLSSDRIVVRGNGPQLQQIVLNLALNASEAMADLPEVARICRVSTIRLPDGSCELAVEDSGPGLPRERREEVFKPFVSSKSTGLGVGLAICRSIAEAHGGTLAFDDPNGTGARAVLKLPALAVTA